MKKLLGLFLISVFLFGCGDKDSKGPVKKSNGELNTTIDNNPPKDINLVYSLQKGQHLSYRISSFTHSGQSIITDTTMSQNVKQTMTYLVDMDVKDVDTDKIMEIEVSLKSISITAEAQGKKISYKSGQKLTGEDKKRFSQYEAFVNNPFVIRIGPKGEIVEISRVDRIVNKFLEIQGLKDSVNATQKKQMQTSIGEGELRPLIQHVFRSLPQNNVGKDSLWNIKTPSRLGVFDVESIAKYKLSNFEKLGNDRLVVIDAGLDVIAKGKTQFSERGINYSFKKPKASGDGKIHFNISKGCVQMSKTSSKYEMSMVMQAPKTPRGPMKATRNDVMMTMNIVELL